MSEESHGGANSFRDKSLRYSPARMNPKTPAFHLGLSKRISSAPNVAETGEQTTDTRRSPREEGESHLDTFNYSCRVPKLRPTPAMAANRRSCLECARTAGLSPANNRPRSHQPFNRLPPVGKLVIAPESCHHVQLDQPELVIQSIQEVLTAAFHSKKR